MGHYYECADCGHEKCICPPPRYGSPKKVEKEMPILRTEEVYVTEGGRRSNHILDAATMQLNEWFEARLNAAAAAMASSLMSDNPAKFISILRVIEDKNNEALPEQEET